MSDAGAERQARGNWAGWVTCSLFAIPIVWGIVAGNKELFLWGLGMAVAASLWQLIVVFHRRDKARTPK